MFLDIARASDTWSVKNATHVWSRYCYVLYIVMDLTKTFKLWSVVDILGECWKQSWICSWQLLCISRVLKTGMLVVLVWILFDFYHISLNLLIYPGYVRDIVMYYVYTEFRRQVCWWFLCELVINIVMYMLCI